MQLTPQDENRIIEMAAKDIADRIWAKLEGAAEEIACLTVNRAAGLLDLTSSQLNRIADEVVDFGPKDRRLSVAQLRRLVAKRTIKRRHA